MDCIWPIWKFLCCSERTAFNSALFVKKYLCCARDIYIPTTPRNFSPIKPFFADGIVVLADITGQYYIHMQDTHYKYDFQPDKTKIDSLRKEETYEFAVCCGCPVLDPEGPWPPFNSRSIVSKIIPRTEEYDHVYILALEKVLEIGKESPVGMFHIRTWGQGDLLEEPFIVDWMRNALKSVKFSVPVLECIIAREGYRPWVELCEYQHLSLQTRETVEVTEKMLSCGFLNVNAVMSNPEELQKFKGFGLIVGYMSQNGFTWDRLFEEIELWKNKKPSSLECFGLFDKQEIPRPPDLFERLSSYSPTGKLLKANSLRQVDVIPLDEENDAAIMSAFEVGICFVRGGWEKWKEVLFAISQSTTQF